MGMSYRNNEEYDKSEKEGEVREMGKSNRQVGTMRRKENKKKLNRRKYRIMNICKKMLKKLSTGREWSRFSCMYK